MKQRPPSNVTRRVEDESMVVKVGSGTWGLLLVAGAFIIMAAQE
jgi:hypothetical protein